MRKIPYGMTDFERIRKEDYYYVDKTRYIAEVERAGSYIFLMRPRRFGKSLFANILAAYYDLKMADKFDAIFKGLDIYDQPTRERGKYMVLKFNFSAVNPDPAMVDESFNFKVLLVLKSFVRKYQDLLPEGLLEQISSVQQCDLALNLLIEAVKWSEHRIYLIVDEYDNFANTMLSYDEEGYKKLTHGTGFFRLFFNILKEATTDNEPAISRMFVTGVTPLTLSDVTSGFNIGRNVSMDEAFNEAIGFSEREVRDLLDYYREATGVFKHTNDEIIDYIRPWYDNYCFAKDCVGQSSLYNPTMIFYFLDKYIKNGVFPVCLIDDIMTSDMDSLWSAVYDKSRDERRTRVLRDLFKTGCSYYKVRTSIEMDSLGDPTNVTSLLYYHGILTYGIGADGYVCPVIPNQSVRGWTLERLEEL